MCHDVLRHTLQGLDDGRAVIPVEAYLSERGDTIVPGVYALFDQAEEVQYIGWSRDVISSLRAQRSRVGPHKATFVRVHTAERGSEAELAAEAGRWIQACAVLPPGNGEERDEWEVVGAVGQISAAGPSDGSYTEEEEVGIRLVGGGAVQPMAALTVEAVDSALEDVRPFLLADGGDVRVAAVEGPDVHLEFQGACSTCPSSAATMSMGIERCLRAAFGPGLRNIIQVNARAPGATVEAVDEHLGLLRGAITSLGGTVSVASVEDGECTILYTGPPALKHGVRAAVQEQFVDLHTVTVLDG